MSLLCTFELDFLWNSRPNERSRLDCFVFFSCVSYQMKSKYIKKQMLFAGEHWPTLLTIYLRALFIRRYSIGAPTNETTVIVLFVYGMFIHFLSFTDFVFFSSIISIWRDSQLLNHTLFGTGLLSSVVKNIDISARLHEIILSANWNFLYCFILFLFYFCILVKLIWNWALFVGTSFETKFCSVCQVMSLRCGLWVDFDGQEFKKRFRNGIESTCVRPENVVQYQCVDRLFILFPLFLGMILIYITFDLVLLVTSPLCISNRNCNTLMTHTVFYVHSGQLILYVFVTMNQRKTKTIYKTFT